jgi:hypothetical protein
MRARWVAGALLAGALPAAAQEVVSSRGDTQLDRHAESKALRLTGSADYVSITKSQANTASIHISGPAVGVGFLYGASRSIGVVGIARQAFSSQSQFSSMFSELALGLSYAITGSLLREGEEIRLNGKVVVQSRDHSSGGLRITVLANQYFLNASSTVVGLSGLGSSLIWEAPSTAAWSWHIGARADIASNGKIVIVPIQGFLGISYWL